MKPVTIVKKTLILSLVVLTTNGCLSVSIKPTTNLEEGKVKTINAEVTSSCGFTRIYAKFKKNTDMTWSDSGSVKQSGNLFSSDVPSSQNFIAGEIYDFRWAVDYASTQESLFSSSCKASSPKTAYSDSSFTVLGCVPGNTSDLSVPMHSQQTNDWCWAASGQMVMDYLGNNVTQCTQANDLFGRNDCCEGNGGICGDPFDRYNLSHSACIKPGLPDFNHYGFDSRESSGLSWNDLRKQLSDSPYCKATPVAFSWNWDGGGGHMMVARGYHEVFILRECFVPPCPQGDYKYVRIHDPWPPCDGDSRIITYDEYMERQGDHTHNVDYFDITRRQ